MYSSSSSPYADRSQDKSYKRPSFPHSQNTLNFSSLGPSNTPQPASQLPNSWSTSFSPQSSLSASTRDGSGYLPGYLLSASQGMVMCCSCTLEGSMFWILYLAITWRFSTLWRPPFIAIKKLALWQYFTWYIWRWEWRPTYASQIVSFPSCIIDSIYRSRQQPLDEDAPPTQSLLDEINAIPLGRDVRLLRI